MSSLLEELKKTQPKWERRYEETVIREFSDYGRGTNALSDARGKLFGAGYEVFIVAFFIGLYSDDRKPLNEDTKTFGVPFGDWGSNRSLDRKDYKGLQDFIFAALVARTDIDVLACDKKECTIASLVAALRKTMEEYANAGFSYLREVLETRPNQLFEPNGFLDIFMSFIPQKTDD